MVLNHVATWSGKERFSPPLFESVDFHHKRSADGLSKWPSGHNVFTFPVEVNRRYIDQAARGLTFLGLPFFYHRDGNALTGTSLTVQAFERVQMAIIFHAWKAPALAPTQHG